MTEEEEKQRAKAFYKHPPRPQPTRYNPEQRARKLKEQQEAYKEAQKKADISAKRKQASEVGMEAQKIIAIRKKYIKQGDYKGTGLE